MKNSFFKNHHGNTLLPLYYVKTCLIFLALIIASIAMTGCGESQSDIFCDDQNDDLYDVNYVDDTYNNFEFDSPDYEAELLTATLMDEAVCFDETEKTDFKSFLSKISVSYPYENLYNFDAVLDKYYSAKEYVSSAESIFEDNSISAEQLFKIVKQNNRELADKAIIEDSKLKEICSMVCEVINDYLKKGKNIDYSLLSRKILKLKIEKFSDFGYGFYDNESNCLSIDVESSESSVGLDKIVFHEVYHLIQNIPSHDNIDYQHGFCCKFGDESINSLNLTWFYEGAAEYLTLNHFGKRDSEIYPTLIKSFDTIKVATILAPDIGTEDFEALSLSKDLDGLFEYFNCVDEKDKREILNMMYAFELNLDLNYISSSRDFYQKYPDIDTLSLKPKLTGSIAQTLSKQFYHHLVSLHDYSVNDIFSLISIFENEISRLTWYDSRREAMQDFFKAYNLIQSEYFRLLAAKLNADPETVIASYNLFNHKTQVNSHEIEALPQEKREFYDYILTTRQDDKTESINITSLASY